MASRDSTESCDVCPSTVSVALSVALLSRAIVQSRLLSVCRPLSVALSVPRLSPTVRPSSVIFDVFLKFSVKFLHHFSGNFINFLENLSTIWPFFWEIFRKFSPNFPEISSIFRKFHPSIFRFWAEFFGNFAQIFRKFHKFSGKFLILGKSSFFDRRPFPAPFCCPLLASSGSF